MSMTQVVSGRGAKRMDMLVDLARHIDAALDGIDSGKYESYKILLMRVGRPVQIVLSKEPPLHPPGHAEPS